MIYVRDKNLVERLSDNGYEERNDLSLKINHNQWQFFCNEQKEKLAVLSLNRVDKKQILIGVNYHIYSPNVAYHDLQMLEDDLEIYKTKINEYIRNSLIGAVAIGLIFQSLEGIVFGALGGGIMTTICNSQKLVLRNTNIIIKGCYNGHSGKDAIKYLFS